MAQPPKRRQALLVADGPLVQALYETACLRWGTARVRDSISLVWTLRCIWGVQNRLPFRTGLVSQNAGELLYVLREVCGLPPRP